jgi:hypothetical protein
VSAVRLTKLAARDSDPGWFRQAFPGLRGPYYWKASSDEGSGYGQTPEDAELELERHIERRRDIAAALRVIGRAGAR